LDIGPQERQPGERRKERREEERNRRPHFLVPVRGEERRRAPLNDYSRNFPAPPYWGGKGGGLKPESLVAKVPLLSKRPRGGKGKKRGGKGFSFLIPTP